MKEKIPKTEKQKVGLPRNNRLSGSIINKFVRSIIKFALVNLLLQDLHYIEQIRYKLNMTQQIFPKYLIKLKYSHFQSIYQEVQHIDESLLM